HGGRQRRLLLAVYRAQPDSRAPSHAVRRPDHRVPDRRTGGAEPSVAKHPQLLPRLAGRVLRYAKEGRDSMRKCLTALIAIVVAMAVVSTAPVGAQSKDEIVIGLQCDRTGATQIVGTVLCPAFHDYIALINSKGGIEGHKIKALEIDHEYKVPPGVESYERHKKEGAVTIAVYGTPHIYALAAKLTED